MSFLIAGARHDTDFWKDIAKQNTSTPSELYSLAETHKRLETTWFALEDPSTGARIK